MNSSDDLIELEFIEALDDLSKKIRLGREEIHEATTTSTTKQGLQRQSSVRNMTRLRLADALDENDDEIDDPGVQALKNLMDSLQELVDALFSHKAFLSYSASLEDVWDSIRPEKGRKQPQNCNHLRMLQCLVNLMKHTVDNHARHPCTELRFVTLLEILLSYQKEPWEHSADINIQWKRLGCKVESGTNPEEFRRQAYQVLVSLPYIPSTCTLFAACSYEDSEAIASWDTLPLCVRSRLEQIPEPLMRSDLVHHILHKIRGREYFTVAISSSTATESVAGDRIYLETAGEGTGKTTLAVLLAAHPSISDNHSVFWVDLGGERWDASPNESPCVSDDGGFPTMSHSTYMLCLQRLCLQLGMSQNWPNFILRLENSQLRALREKQHMKLAKSCISQLFKAIEGKILFVLDGVRDESDFEWFQFLDDQSTIVVTSGLDVFVPRVTYTMEVQELGIDEALQLFASESSHDRQQILFETIEARTIAKQCLYHPLIIRSTAHWFKLKQVTSGLRKGLEELKLELSVLKSAKWDCFKVLTEILNMVLSPTTRAGGDASKVMKLCLSSVAVVFSDSVVPMDAVLSLWSELFAKHPDAVAEVSDGLPDVELIKRVWYFMEAFMHLGVFALSDENGVLMVRLYHQLFVRYGLSQVSEINGNASLENTRAAWNRFFVDGYIARRKRIQAVKDSDDNCRPYALRRLIYHMIEAKMIPRVLELLKDDNWCRERISIYGWYEGSKIHVDDCEHLKRKALASETASPPETRKVVLSCLKKMALLLSEETPNLTDASRVEKAMAMHLVGFMLAENGGINEALNQYKNGMTLMTNPSHPLNAIITHSQATVHLSRNDVDKALKKAKACLKVLSSNDVSHDALCTLLKEEAVQMKGDAFLALCDYTAAEESYEEALDLMKEDRPIETGMALYRRGVLHHIVGELDQAIAAINESITIKVEAGETCSVGLCHAYSRVGDLHFEFQEHNAALKNYELALDIAKDLEIEDEGYAIVSLNGKISFLLKDEEGYMNQCREARKIIRECPTLLIDKAVGDLCILGKMCKDSGRLKDTVDIFQDALELTKDRPECLQRASAFFELGLCHYELGEFKEAISCLDSSLKIRMVKLGDCEMVLDAQLTIGNIFKQLGMQNEYLDVSKDVMYLTEKLYKGNEEKAASALYGVAEAYEILGEYDQAVAMYEECKETLKRSLCNDHPDVADCLRKLAIVHTLNGNYDKAVESYTMAIRIMQANFEPYHPQIAELQFEAGVVSRKKGDYESARRHLQDALKIQKSLELVNETSLSLIELGNVHRLLKEPDIAVGCYEKCIDILCSNSDDRAIMSNLYLSLGHAKLSLKETADASKSFDRALKNRIELYGRDHAETALASRSMGIVKYMTESFAEARIYLSDYARVMELAKTVESVDYILVHLLLGQMNRSESLEDDAIRAWEKAGGILSQQPSLGENVPGLKDLVDHVVQSCHSRKMDAREPKSFFSRFSEMARFEEEVGADIPVSARLEEMLLDYVFLDEL
ncbi:tetratricopeptide repeat protein [Nitzschia inconspicua]|uniref:Tetratricopeptide repeat protein n=1 Tax=Nitzschia inconspicua TaxID=303405 RepID=A0A9K3PCS0_9STRA|nr:tetratricopeptide repeat protein [Nitzschia inconspicua]